MSQGLNEIQELILSIEVCDPDAIAHDLQELLINKRAHLVLKSNTFYFDDGTEKQLLCLMGTISTVYSGNCYYIPVELWLQESHPYIQPICYVKPTVNMFISSTCPYVDASGKISSPYLYKWSPGESSLTKLIDNLSLLFSENTPVYSINDNMQSSESPKMPKASNNHSSNIDQSNKLKKEDTNDNRCNICMQNDIDCVLLECGHVVSCSTCAVCFVNCPVCRSKIDRIKKIFRS